MRSFLYSPNNVVGEFLNSISSFDSQYLHKLFKRDHHKGQRYHEKQISLYAEYDRPNLLPFLRDSTHCPLEKVSPITPVMEFYISCLQNCTSVNVSGTALYCQKGESFGFVVITCRSDAPSPGCQQRPFSCSSDCRNLRWFLRQKSKIHT